MIIRKATLDGGPKKLQVLASVAGTPKYAHALEGL